MLPAGWKRLRVNVSSYDFARVASGDPRLSELKLDAWRKALVELDGEVYHIELGEVMGRVHSAEFRTTATSAQSGDGGAGSCDAWALVDVPQGAEVVCGATIVGVKDDGSAKVLGTAVSQRCNGELTAFFARMHRQGLMGKGYVESRP